MLSWEEINEMAKNGISFGAHTVNHPILSNVPLSVAERELHESKNVIEAKTGRQVSVFAYPFGKKEHYNQTLYPLLKRLNFTCAVTTVESSNRHGVNLFSLSRNYPWELFLF